MQLVCEDRLHISQVGAVGSSLGSYPRGRQFESGTLQHHFLGDTKVRFISFLVIIERHIVRENSMPFKMVLWCNGSTRDFGSLRDCSIQSRTTQFIFSIIIKFIHNCMTACESSSTKTS